MNKSICLGLHSLQKKKEVSTTLILSTIRLGKLDLLFTYLSLFEPVHLFMLPPHYLASIVFFPLKYSWRSIAFQWLLSQTVMVIYIYYACILLFLKLWVVNFSLLGGSCTHSGALVGQNHCDICLCCIFIG